MAIFLWQFSSDFVVGHGVHLRLLARDKMWLFFLSAVWLLVERGLFALAAVVGIERFSALHLHTGCCALVRCKTLSQQTLAECVPAYSLSLSLFFLSWAIWGSREEHTLHIDGSDLFASDARTYDNMLQLVNSLRNCFGVDVVPTVVPNRRVNPRLTMFFVAISLIKLRSEAHPPPF